MQDAAVRSVGVVSPVDTTDWLKTAAIIFAAAGHFGYFFMENERWWSVVGRLAGPVLFFLLGYARSRTVPLYWIWLGIFLTLLDVWNADWGWMPVNILLSFALIRIARPSAQKLLQDHGWAAFALMAAILIGLVPTGVKFVDYGTGGWLWALFGVCQRLYTGMHSNAQNSPPFARPTGATNTWPDASLRLRDRRSCLCLAGAARIPVPSCPSRSVHYGARRSLREPLPVPAWPKPRAAVRACGRHAALRRPAYPGTLCHPACRLRARYKAVPRPRRLTAGHGLPGRTEGVRKIAQRFGLSGPRCDMHAATPAIRERCRRGSGIAISSTRCGTRN
jgi:hypothetical protein